MPPRPSQKRAHGSFSDASTSQSQKKTRFLEPTEDPVNFAEEVDSKLEDHPSATRRGRVKTEGYESDSSGEEDAGARRRGKERGQPEEEEDMFTMGDKEETKEDEDGKKKEEKYLRLGDIEGQEFMETRSGEESSDESEPEDEDDAERKKKKGMGYELSSFNMREEMEEGKFAEDGTYIRTFDPHAIHDRWMDGVDEKEMKRARKRHRQRQKQEKERQEAEERELNEMGGKEALEKQLIAMLKKGESVLEALARLGAQAKKQNGNQKRSKPNNRHKSDIPAGDVDMDDQAPKEKTQIEQLTHLASTLMSLGDTDIYSKTWEEVVRSLRASGRVDQSWLPPSADPPQYEYKWDVPGSTAQEGQAFGPYSEEDMQAWFKAAYFGMSGEKVKVRRVGGDWGSWSEVVPPS